MPLRATPSDVCAGCFEDEDLRDWIESVDGEPGCGFCGKNDFSTAPLDEVVDFIRERIKTFYSQAIDELSHDSGEGGYEGSTYDTEDILFFRMELELPRDEDEELRDAILEPLRDEEPWCEYDPARVDPDEGMILDWERFSHIVKYERRFFFHKRGEKREDFFDESLSPRQLLRAIARSINERELFADLATGYRIFRARIPGSGYRLTSARDFGPPPSDCATQWNRLNPPGIPVLYASENAALAAAEVGEGGCVIGEFEAVRDLRLLDLADLPRLPGVFSGASRDDFMAMRFLHTFSDLIVQPVDREDRTVLDYIPTQVFTEFLRDFRFDGGPICGIKYRSASGLSGANLALFATQEHVADPGEETEHTWLRLTDVEW